MKKKLLLTFLRASLAEADPRASTIRQFPETLGVLLARLETAIQYIEDGDDDAVDYATSRAINSAASRFQPPRGGPRC